MKARACQESGPFTWYKDHLKIRGFYKRSRGKSRLIERSFAELYSLLRRCRRRAARARASAQDLRFEASLIPKTLHDLLMLNITGSERFGSCKIYAINRKVKI